MQDPRLKSFLMSGIVCLLLLLSFFYTIGSFENGASDAVIVSLFSAAVIAAIYTYFKHFYRKINSPEAEEERNRQKAARAEAEAMELEDQVKNYNNLGVAKSYRKQAAIVILLVIGLSILLGSEESAKYVVYESLLYIPLAYFVFKGHRWAMFVVFILLTLNYLFRIAEVGFSLSMVFYWGIIGIPLFRAIQVENRRRVKSLIP